jgi:hypothetical protein
MLVCLPGCRPRYLVSGPEALRAVAELETQGEAVVEATVEDGEASARSVRVRVEGTDGYRIMRGRTVLEEFGVTDRGMIEGADRLVLAYRHRATSLAATGVAMLVPGLIVSWIGAGLTGDGALAAPVTGLAVAMERSRALARDEPCDLGFCPPRLYAALSGILLVQQLVGVGMILAAVWTWDDRREPSASLEDGPSLTLTPFAGPEGSLGGVLGLAF